MAATFVQLGQIASSGSFQSRVAFAMSSEAATVYAESPTTAGHGVRANFANKVASGNYNLNAACLAVLTNSTVLGETSAGANDTNILDADIQTAVNGLWNLLAGV